MGDDRHSTDIDETEIPDSLAEDLEQDQAEGERAEVGVKTDEDHEEGDEEEVFSFGDDAEEQDGDTDLVKHLRGELKKRGERIAELEKGGTRQEEPIEAGEKPTLAGCDYDEEEYDRQRDAWEERRRKAEEQKSKASTAEDAERAAWQQELTRVETEKLQLGAADAEEAFDTVRAALNTMQQAVLVKATEAGNTARLIYALAKHPAKLAELAEVTDPLRLAAKIAKLEGQMRVVKVRRAPAPDRPERGSARTSRQTTDKQLEKLEKEAERTGDRTELQAYRRKLRQAAATK